MVWVSDGDAAINDWDIVHLSFCEGSHALTLVGDGWRVVIVANEIERETCGCCGSGIIRYNDTELSARNKE